MVFCHKYLLFVREVAVPVSHRVAWLYDNREAKWRLVIFVCLVGTGVCLWKCKSVLLAYLVKTFFHGKFHKKLFVYTFKTVKIAKFVLIAHKELNVVVAARHQKKCLALMFACKLSKCLYKNFVIFNVRLLTYYCYDPAVCCSNKSSLTYSKGLKAVLLVKGSCHSVSICIGTKKYRYKINLFHY